MDHEGEEKTRERGEPSQVISACGAAPGVFAGKELLLPRGPRGTSHLGIAKQESDRPQKTDRLSRLHHRVPDLLVRRTNTSSRRSPPRSSSSEPERTSLP